MREYPARKRRLNPVRRLDHDAVDARLEASLVEYEELSRQAGVEPEDAVERVRSHLLAGEVESRPTWRLLDSRLILVIGAIVVIAALLVVGSALRSSPAALTDRSNPMPTLGSPSQVPTAAAGFAELYVTLFLSEAGEGHESVLGPFLDAAVDLSGMTPGRFYVQNAAVIGGDYAENKWQLRVGVQSLQRVEGGYGDPVLQVYEVAVRERGSGWLADGLPILGQGLR